MRHPRSVSRSTPKPSQEPPRIQDRARGHVPFVSHVRGRLPILQPRHQSPSLFQSSLAQGERHRRVGIFVGFLSITLPHGTFPRPYPRANISRGGSGDLSRFSVVQLAERGAITVRSTYLPLLRILLTHRHDVGIRCTLRHSPPVLFGNRTGRRHLRRHSPFAPLHPPPPCPPRSATSRKASPPNLA